MKFSCRKYDLQQKLAQLDSITVKDKKGSDSPTSYFLFDLIGNVLWLAASCHELNVLTELKVETDEQGALLVDAKTITELLKSLPDKQIQVSIKPDKMQLQIKVDRSKYVISGMDRTLFPALETPQQWDYKISVKFLRSAIAKTVPLIKGESSSMPHLNGALLCLENKKLEMMATDENQLAVITDGFENDGKFYCVIPRKTLQEVGKALTECSDPYIEFTGTDKAAFFRVGNSIFQSRLLYGRMPNYTVLIDGRLKQNQRHFKIHRTGLLAATRRCMIFNEREKASRVFLDFTSEELNIRSANTRGDAASEFVQSRTDERSGYSLQVNGQYLINYLSAVEDEYVDLLMEEPESPIIFRAEGSHNFVFLVMPLRG